VKPFVAIDSEMKKLANIKVRRNRWIGSSKVVHTLKTGSETRGAHIAWTWGGAVRLTPKAERLALRLQVEHQACP
jgi:hypothetical protein